MINTVETVHWSRQTVNIFVCEFPLGFVCFRTGSGMAVAHCTSRALWSQGRSGESTYSLLYCDYLHGPSSSLKYFINFKPESISDNVQYNKTTSACVPSVLSKFLKTLKTPLVLQVFNVNDIMSSFNSTLCLRAAVARPLVLCHKPQ